ARISSSCCGPFGSQPISSCRDHCTRTGCPIVFDSRTASAAAWSPPLVPYDPDPSAKITRSLLAFSPNTFARLLRRPCVPCDADQTVPPSPRMSATAHDGPSDAWLWNGQKYVAACVFGAPAMAAFASPRLTIDCSRSTAAFLVQRSRPSLPG